MPVHRRNPRNLKALARACGGDTYAGGRRALLPAPGRSAADRSVSPWLRGDRVVAHSFAGGGWREVLDDLRATRRRAASQSRNRIMCRTIAPQGAAPNLF